MTTLRTAAQQALEALEADCGGRCNAEYNPCWQREVAETLRAALAEHDKNLAWFKERKANWDLQRKLAEETEERDRLRQEDALQRLTDVNQEIEAEPVEPVAWIQPDHLQKARRAPFLCRVEPTKRMVDFVALFTAPPQRKPLSAIDLRALYDRHAACQEEGPETSGWWDFARAIERTYGIG